MTTQTATPATTNGKPELERTSKEPAHSAPPLPKASTEIVKTQPASLVVPSVSQLNAAVAKVRALKGDLYVVGWHLGAAVRDILDTHSWKARVADGKQAHKSFEDFCDAELGMSRSMTKNLCDVSRNFTESQFREVGVTKLALVLQVPEKHRAQLTEKASTTSRAALKAEVQHIKDADEAETGKRFKNVTPGRRTNDPKSGKAPKKKASSASAPERTEVSVALMINKSERIFLFAEPAKKGDAPQPAKLADLKKGAVQGYYDCKRTRLFFAVKETPSGQLAIFLKPKRIEKGERVTAE